MYSLLVCQDVEERSKGTFKISRSRFLEYTRDSISDQLQALSVEARECIKSWPCILMQEGRGQEEAYVGEITALEVAGADVEVTIRLLPSESIIINDALWRTRDALDIEKFEFSRNHWAIKDRDLFPTLAATGYAFADSIVSRFDHKPLPTPQRSDLIRARNSISDWSHTEIDDFLLEAGVSGLSAERSVGSRRDRANAIVEFVLENPTVTTAENSLFSAFIVRAATSSTDDVEFPDDPDGASRDVAEPLPGLGRAASETSSRTPNRVFVVHGKNASTRANVVSFLSSLGLEGIVLHEQASMGRHLLTKFIEEAELVTFAIVLMTDDDVGGVKGSDLAPRARQNVILELGYFLAHLGQQRVCALITPGLETPSDFDGIVYIRMDQNERWKTELRRELRAAEMPLTKE